MTRHTNSSTIVKFVFFVMLMILVFSVISMQKQLRELKEAKANLEQQVVEITDQIEEANLRYNTPKSDEYLERLARDKFGYCYPNEIVYYNDLID